MKICLIRPPGLLKVFSFIMKPSPPLGLALIGGALKEAGHDVTVIDAIAENAEQIVVFHNDIYANGLTFGELAELVPRDTEMIGLNLMFTCNWLSDRKLIDFLGERFPGVKIIAGGEHITSVPELCIRQTKHLDVCVTGEGEETVVDLAEALEKGRDLSSVPGIAYRECGKVITNPRRTRVKDVEAIPMPAWELFPLDAYQKHQLGYGVTNGEKSLPLMATRGCPYSCTFCSSPKMWGTRYYMRSPEGVADEIEYLNKKFGVSNFDFFDLTAIIKKDWILGFTEELINRKLNITWQIPAGTRSEAIDREVAHNLYLSGCTNITYAPESGSAEILRKIKKKVCLQKMFDSIRFSHEEKMNIKINIIVGFPEESHYHIWQTIWLLIKASWYGVNDIAPGLFSPYPGSELFDRLVASGEIDVNSDDYFFRIFYAESFFDNHIYNHRMHRYFLRAYLILYIIAFYSTNYLFRPQRFFISLHNMLTKKFKCRTEMALYDLFRRKSYKVKASSMPGAF